MNEMVNTYEMLRRRRAFEAAKRELHLKQLESCMKLQLFAANMLCVTGIVGFALIIGLMIGGF